MLVAKPMTLASKVGQLHHSLDPPTNDLQKLSDTQSTLMYHSVVKVKNGRLEFFKIKFQSLLCARQVQVMPMQYFTAAC